jgi:hypothetical protein
MNGVFQILLVVMFSYAFWRLIRWLDGIFFMSASHQARTHTGDAMNTPSIAGRLIKGLLVSLFVCFIGILLVFIGYSIYLESTDENKKIYQ